MTVLDWLWVGFLIEIGKLLAVITLIGLVAFLVGRWR